MQLPFLPLENLWASLRGHTSARIGLARTGASLATAPVLAARMAHAQARDAVHARLDRAQLANALSGLDLTMIQVNSAAPDRHTYLLRPDLGRRLDQTSAEKLDDRFNHQIDKARPDLVVVVTDGLSARAAQDHAAPVLNDLFSVLRSQGLYLGPVVLARHGRVALGDDIGARLRTTAVLVLLGERPGWSSPDSLGAYLTWAPKVGRSDAERNCVSNIRPIGLAPAAAAKIAWLLQRMRALKSSGVTLKDDAAVPGPVGSESESLT